MTGNAMSENSIPDPVERNIRTIVIGQSASATSLQELTLIKKGNYIFTYQFQLDDSAKLGLFCLIQEAKNW